jgi:hypothetical protein
MKIRGGILTNLANGFWNFGPVPRRACEFHRSHSLCFLEPAVSGFHNCLRVPQLIGSALF